MVAGGIAILRPFVAASRPFLRDVAFYMTAVFLTFTALYLGKVTLAWALGERGQPDAVSRGGGGGSETGVLYAKGQKHQQGTLRPSHSRQGWGMRPSMG